MNFYQQQHEFYCGIDLHARNLYACVVDQGGNKHLHRNFRCSQPERLLQRLLPVKDQIVVGCESTFNWYWLADLCRQHQIPFVLGHAHYMRCIHGGKTKNDKLDSEKIAYLLRGGNFPLSYAYPRELRATRDLMRRRSHYVRRRAEAMAHLRLLYMQYNLPPIAGSLDVKKNRIGVAERLPNASARMSASCDLQTIEDYDRLIGQLESYLQRTTRVQDPQTYYRLRSIPGVGSTLAMIFMYEIGHIGRFGSVGKFLSYARLVRGQHTSAGKRYSSSGHKIGNPHLKWAFSEAALLCRRCCPQARAWSDEIEQQQGKARSLTRLASKLGRAIYYMLKKQQAFDPQIFQATS